MFDRSRPPRPGTASTPTGRGQSLDTGFQTRMNAHFGHDFSQVRIHTDTDAGRQARTEGAAAYTVGEDIVFGAGVFQQGSPGTERLLAHELTHVVQQTQHGPGDPARASERGDASEREADTVAASVLAGHSARVQSAPDAAIARTEDDSSGGGILSTISSVASGVWNGEVAGERQNAANVRSAENAFDSGVDWLEGGVSSLAHGAAGLVGGVPILGGLANAGADSISDQAQLGGGILKGAGGLVGGLANVAADPIDAAKGMEAMAEHVQVVPGMPNPLRAAHNLLNVATGDESWGQFGSSLNPTNEMNEDAQFMGHVGSAIIDPYRREVAQGKGMEAVGRGVFDIGSILATAGGGAAVAGTADALRGAGIVSDVSRGAQAVSDVSRGAEVASDVVRGTQVADEVSSGVRATQGATDINGMIEEELASAGPEIRNPGATPIDPAGIAPVPRQPGPIGPRAATYQPGGAVGPLDPAMPAPNPNSSSSMVRALIDSGMPEEDAGRFGRQVDAIPEEPDPYAGGNGAGTSGRPTSYAKNRVVENNWRNGWRP